MIETFEEKLKAALMDGEMPGVAVAASNGSGSFSYERGFGSTLLGKPVNGKSAMWLASCTKLVTSIAAMQMVEQGKLWLDSPAEDVLPELAGLKLLRGYDDDDSPILVPVAEPPTLRHLLTHSAGFTYPGMMGLMPLVDKYHSHRLEGGTLNGVNRCLLTPVGFEPGSAWCYSGGIDFAGAMVARVSGMTLDEYVEQRIFARCGVKSTAFGRSPKLGQMLLPQKELIDMARRDASGHLSIDYDAVPSRAARWSEAFGGEGLCGTVGDYIKVLRAVLNPGVLLQKASLDEMFQPQLGEQARQSYMTLAPLGPYTLSTGLPPNILIDHGLGGSLCMEDVADFKRKGTMSWGGMPNLFWFIDRDNDLCGVFGTQLLPADDKVAGELGKLWEKAIRNEHARYQATLES